MTQGVDQAFSNILILHKQLKNIMYVDFFFEQNLMILHLIHLKIKKNKEGNLHLCRLQSGLCILHL